MMTIRRIVAEGAWSAATLYHKIKLGFRTNKIELSGYQLFQTKPALQ